MTLSLSFLGPFQVTLDDRPAIFATDRVRALLAYLAVESDRPHRRDALAGLIWPDRPEMVAHRNLSQTLARLRRAVGDQYAVPPCLLITRKTIQFNAVAADLDVDRFKLLLETCATHDHLELASCPSCIERLEQAAALYRGAFLQGLFLTGSQPFEEWALFKRERLHRRALDVLHALTVHYERQGNYDQARRYAERQIGLEPWREEAHRQLMRALASGQQRSAALAQYTTCCRLLADELGVEPSAETTALYQCILKGEVVGAGQRFYGLSRLPGASSLEQRHNLPLQMTPFIARDTELAELSRLLADPEVRLVTILGPGGMGKSRLAIQAARAQLGAYAHGVWYVPLSVADPAVFAGSIDPVIATLADTLKLAFHGNETPHHQLLAYLQDKEMLIVLDNFEHLLDSVDLVSDFVTQSPRLKVLVTSRERLNLIEEWLLILQGLPTPPEDASALDLMNYGAIRLFWQHARQVQPHMDLAAEQGHIVRICRLVDGMPLAIELAAAWVRLIPCQEIAKEIEKSIDFLSTTLRNVPERHRSLRAVFDHSWGLLAATEQAVFQKLSLFRGGFQREAAEVIAGASVWLLSALVDKSLLKLTPSGRYEIHELLRQYAAEKLRQVPGEYEQARDRHSFIYLDFLQRQEARLKGKELKVAIEAIAADIDNVRAAWRWAVERDWLLAIKQALLSHWHFYEAKGWHLEADDALGQAITRLRQQCDQRPSSSEPGAPTGNVGLILGAMLAHKAWFETRLGRFEPAKAHFQAALSLLRQAGDGAQPEIGLSLIFFGAGACFWGEPQLAIPLLQESLTLFNQLDEPWGKGTAMSLLGQAHVFVARYAEAEPLLQKSIAILDRIGNRMNLPYAMSALAYIAQKRGQMARAEKYHLDCLDIRQDVGDRTGMAFTLCDLGEVARQRGAYAQAEEYYQQCLAITEAIAFRAIRAECLRGLGNLAENRKDYVVARHFFQECLDISQAGGLFGHSPSALTGLGWAALGLKEYDEARHCFRDALKLETTTQRHSLALDALTGLAHYWAESGEGQRALECLGLILQHPTTTQETKNRAAVLQRELTNRLPPEVVTAAQARAKRSTLDGMVAQVLDEDV
jgi:predicted ATPase/DNA-binding SARP family transcriptional activator